MDLVPASSRPYVGSSTDNSEIELIIGHNGLERLGLSTSKNSKDGNNIEKRISNTTNSITSRSSTTSKRTTTDAVTSTTQKYGTPPNMGNGGPTSDVSGYDGRFKDGNRPEGFPGGNGMQRSGGGGNSTFGGKEGASIIRLFSNNSLSDQIIWMLPLAIFGFLAAAIKEKLTLKFDNKKKQALLLWIAWLVPEFIYFSYTTGLFHPYYLTMMAAPIAALAGIGIVSMWQLYKEEEWKFWILPAALASNGAVQLLILSYNYNSAAFVKYIMIAVSVLCFASSLGLVILKFIKNKEEDEIKDKKITKLKKALVVFAMTGLLITPLIWSGTTMFYKMQGTFPAAGLSLIKGSGNGQ